MNGCRLSILVLAGACLGGVAQGRDAAALIAAARTHYSSVQSLQAEFTQIYTADFVRNEEKGLVLLKKPGRMYWEYRDPVEKYLIADGENAYFYVPRDRQVVVYKMSQLDDRLFLFFLGGRDPSLDFRIEFETEETPLETGNHLLRLQPLKEDGFVSHILIEIEKETFAIRRLVSVETLGQRNDYVLNNVRENVSIPNRRFRFRIPKGVEIIQQDQ